VEYKKQPLGKIAWFDNVDATEARLLTQEVLSSIADENGLVNADEKRASEIFEKFNISISPDNNQDSLIIKVRNDKLFGPLIKVSDGKGKTLTRITPLTDRDISEIKSDFNIDDNEGVWETLGKISQMIEELPWLWEMEVYAVKSDKPIITGDIKMVFNVNAKSRPDY